MARFQELTTPIMISAGVGIADGWLARQDINSPTRAVRQLSQFSFWGELAGVGGGLVINQQARSPFQETLALSLISASTALLARRAGVMTAQSMEVGTPQTAVFTAPQPVGFAAGQAIAPLALPAPRGSQGHFVETAAERTARANQGRFV
jgi:hypothetical protein